MPFTKEQRRAYDKARNRTSASRNSARTTRRTAHEITFIGLDGEGVDRPDGSHDYNLLTTGRNALHHPDGRRLTTNEIFTHLWETHDPKAAHVGFFLGYDLAQWLRDLPEERARMLLTRQGIAARRRVGELAGRNPTPHPVRWGRWEFDVMPNLKRFKLRPSGSTKANWMYVCDAGPLYQQSLLQAIDPESWTDPICTPDEFEVIQAGKQARGVGTVPRGTPVDEATIAYNALENELLARLMTRTNEGFVAMDPPVKLTRVQWFGPGQAAQAWLKQVGSAHTGDKCRNAAPPEIHEAAQASYFGGWFEIMAHGPVPGTTYEYDVNSAYPSITATLPCLLHGTWTEGTGAPQRRSGHHTLVWAVVTGGDPHIGPMPHRTAKKGVCRPSWTAGWMWLHELDAARRAGLVSSTRYRTWWDYEPCDCPPPFRRIADLYESRLTAGKKTPQGFGMKLVYNSAYGKFAQSAGHPMFGNAVYASLITAGCRTQILDAIATHPEGPEAVAMVATDGIYFTAPHPDLDLDPERLGAWDESTKENLSLFKPGVYWDDGSRRAVRRGEKLRLKSRGVDAGALARALDRIDAQWPDLDPQALPEDWPAVDIIVPFGIVSPRQALNRGRWELCGHIQHDTVIAQSSAPHLKRAPWTWKDGTLRSLVLPNRNKVESLPYDRTFGLELEEQANEMPILTEGDVAMALRELGIAS